MFNEPSKRKVLSFTMVLGLLVLFTVGAYTSHEFPGEPYRDDFRSPLIQEPANDFIAGPYRSDFDYAVEGIYGPGFSAGPYRSDFNDLLAEKEISGEAIAGPYKSDFAGLRGDGRKAKTTKESIGGPYRADFNGLRSE